MLLGGVHRSLALDFVFSAWFPGICSCSSFITVDRLRTLFKKSSLFLCLSLQVLFWCVPSVLVFRACNRCLGAADIVSKLLCCAEMLWGKSCAFILSHFTLLTHYVDVAF
ncbi:hypothetical protein F2P56_026668 [Juglans regia]|uniref:Uncharacterized protein n=1 Tax=Juglans regia TaxID=51240 RepID=A0A833U8S2_JUGRE|nr:hypothetical protein F2P56_026668 [Juglans regia]